MICQTIQIGLKHTQTVTVDDQLIVPAVARSFSGFSDMPPVFATAFLLGLVEWTCIELLRPFVATSWRTVGTHADINHSAATPIGMRVSAEVELVEIEGRRFRFNVTCRDEVDQICAGRHERALVNEARFIEALSRKTALAFERRTES